MAQHNISSGTRKSNFYLIRTKQRLLIKSLWSKLITVRDMADEQFSKDGFMFSSEDKFRYVLLLGNTISNFSLYDFYSSKNLGLSLSLQVFSFYRICLDYLLKISFIPFVETNIDKFLISSRPYKLYTDVPVELNRMLLKDINKSFVVSFEISNYFSSTSEIWLYKNSTLNPRILKNFFVPFNYVDKDKKLRCFESFYSVIFNFMLNGMLWISLLIKIN